MVHVGTHCDGARQTESEGVSPLAPSRSDLVEYHLLEKN